MRGLEICGGFIRKIALLIDEMPEQREAYGRLLTLIHLYELLLLVAIVDVPATASRPLPRVSHTLRIPWQISLACCPLGWVLRGRGHTPYIERVRIVVRELNDTISVYPCSSNQLPFNYYSQRFHSSSCMYRQSTSVSPKYLKE